METLLTAFAKDASLLNLALMLGNAVLAGALAAVYRGWRQDISERNSSLVITLEKLTEVITALRIEHAKGQKS